MAYIAVLVVLFVELFFAHVISGAMFSPQGLMATALIFLSGYTSAEVGLFIVRNPLRPFGDMLSRNWRQVGQLIEVLYTYCLIAAPIALAVWLCLTYMPGSLELHTELFPTLVQQSISCGFSLALVMGFAGWFGAPIRFGSLWRLFMLYRPNRGW